MSAYLSGWASDLPGWGALLFYRMKGGKANPEPKERIEPKNRRFDPSSLAIMNDVLSSAAAHVNTLVRAHGGTMTLENTSQVAKVTLKIPAYDLNAEHVSRKL